MPVPSAMPSIDELNKLLEMDPTDTFVLYGLAQEYAKAGETDRAVEHYDRCLSHDPSYCYAYYHKARALEEDGRTEEALEAVKAGLVAAREARDDKALGELMALADELS